MRYLAYASAVSSRVPWRGHQTVVRLAILALVAGAIAASLVLRDNFDLEQVGYGAVAVSVLVASGGLVIPVPALAASCAAAAFLNPLYVGLIAGSAGALGELTGYSLGYTGRGVISKTRLYLRLESWMRRRGWLVLFVISAVPNPIFDVAGIAAGALRYPLWRFMLVVWAGKLLKYLSFAFACDQGVRWITGWSGA